MIKNPIFVFLVCFVVYIFVKAFVNALRRIKEMHEQDEETPVNVMVDSSVLIMRGDMNVLRSHLKGMTDLQILHNRLESFRKIFIESVNHYGGDPEKIDEMFNIQVYFDLGDSNVLISKSEAKNEQGEKIMENLARLLKDQPNAEINFP